MSDDNKPKLASLVQAGEQQKAAEAIADFIFMVKDISNAYLINTGDGDVMINTGFMGSSERNRDLLAPVRTGSLQAIVLTQAHADHYGGVPVFRESTTRIITQRRFPDTCDYFRMLDPYLRRRSGKLWSGTIKGRDQAVPTVTPDVLVDERHTFSVGDKTFEVISTPGGESLDSVIVWMAEERIVFTGNLFGPVFMSMPNFCTVRGDKPRSARRFLASLNTVRSLEPDLMITGHGEPIRGSATIRSDLDKLHDAVSFIHDATVDGMNAGRDVYTLMREIQLPPALKIGEFHGKVTWAVRTIWEEYSGWFHLQSPTELYGVPRSSIDGDLVELSGGPAALAHRAQQLIGEDQAVRALHLLDIALGANPDHHPSLNVKKMALERLLEQSAGDNLSEVMWLKSELSATQTSLQTRRA